MKKYIAKRILYMILVLLIISFLMYFLYNLIPNDPARAELEPIKKTLKPEAYEQMYQQLRLEMGLDDPLIVRYARWLGLVADRRTGETKGLLQGYLGYSIFFKTDVVNVIPERMLNTVFINIFVTILALGITIPLGIYCAVHKKGVLDNVTQVCTIVGYSIPTFITAIIFIWLFAIILGWFPVSGMKTPGSDYVGWQKLKDELYYMCLPLIVMTFSSLGGMTRYVRAAMIEALSLDCIRTARAKGLREKVVIYSHAFRNALIPISTLAIGWFISIFSGSIVIENIFGLNGVGRVYILSLNNKDFEVVLLLQMFYVIIGLLGNLIVDIAYGLIDPRVRVNK